MAASLLGLICLACGPTIAPTLEPMDFFLKVQDIDGPPVVIVINDVAVATTNCGEQRLLVFRPGQNGVPALPWKVSVKATDGTELDSATLDGSLSHTWSVRRFGTEMAGPTPFPGRGPQFPCPSLYFASPGT